MILAQALLLSLQTSHRVYGAHTSILLYWRFFKLLAFLSHTVLEWRDDHAKLLTEALTQRSLARHHKEEKVWAFQPHV